MKSSDKSCPAISSLRIDEHARLFGWRRSREEEAEGKGVNIPRKWWFWRAAITCSEIFEGSSIVSERKRTIPGVLNRVETRATFRPRQMNLLPHGLGPAPTYDPPLRRSFLSPSPLSPPLAVFFFNPAFFPTRNSVTLFVSTLIALPPFPLFRRFYFPCFPAEPPLTPRAFTPFLSGLRPKTKFLPNAPTRTRPNDFPRKALSLSRSLIYPLGSGLSG